MDTIYSIPWMKRKVLIGTFMHWLIDFVRFIKSKVIDLGLSAIFTQVVWCIDLIQNNVHHNGCLNIHASVFKHAHWFFIYHISVSSFVKYQGQRRATHGTNGMITPWHRAAFRITLSYSISQEICKSFVVLCFVVVMQSFIMNSHIYIYPYSSGLLCWHWGNR